MLQVLTLDRFNAGQSSDIKEGVKASFWYSRHADFRKAPSKITVLPRTVKQSGNINDLIVAIVQVADGSWYMVGNLGYIYKRSVAGVITNFGKITGDTTAYGMFYRRDQDAILITGARDVHEISPINNPSVNPTLKISKYAQSKSTDTGATATGGAQIYNVPITVNETATGLRSFVSDIEPLYSIKVKIPTKGTGDWTLTLHDAANNLLATSTVTNSNITAGGLVEFVFATPVRLLVKPNGRTYHFHLTSTVADGTAQVTTANDLSTADYEIWANRLVPTTSGFHPAGNFLQYNMFGNGRYLSQWEPLTDAPSNLEWLRHKLVLPDGYEITSMQQWQQYWAMAAEKRTSSGVFQDGKIFLWDGTAQTYNDYVNVPQGSPYSLYTDESGILNFYAANAHYQFSGGNQATKIKTFRNTDSEFSQAADVTIAYPNMMTTRRSILLMGYPSQSTNPNLEHGVYSYGATDKNYLKAFGFSYSISPTTLLNNGTNNLRIGCVQNTGDTLFISWRDDSQAPQQYGLDIVDNFSTPYGTAILESLIFDNSKLWKRKNAHAIKLQIPVLPAGCSVRIGWQINRSGSFTYSPYRTTVGELYYGFSKKSFREIQFRIEVVVPTDGTVTTSPELTGFSFQFDDLEKEKMFK